MRDDCSMFLAPSPVTDLIGFLYKMAKLRKCRTVGTRIGHTYEAAEKKTHVEHGLRNVLRRLCWTGFAGKILCHKERAQA